MESCQKNNSNSITPTTPNIQDSAETQTGINYKQLINTFWIDSRDVNEYDIGFRFSSDTSVTYSFIGYADPVRFDSVYYFWNFVKPDTLTIFDDMKHTNVIGVFTIYSITDSLIRCHISAYTDTVDLWRVF